VRIPVLVIGGGLSGLAAAIRIARFTPDVLLLEKHSRLGGLNSYFYRNGTLYETGLHAITNFALPGDKRAPLNRLLRQLKLRRRELILCQQFRSEIRFSNSESLFFSNDFAFFKSQVEEKFPAAADNFRKLLIFLEEFDPFVPGPFRSAKSMLLDMLGDPLLVEMILCPLMYYGSSNENDMDLAQFAIMFRAIFQEGMFRPQGTIKDFLDLLAGHLESLGGTIQKNCAVQKIKEHDSGATAILATGEEVECDYILSTIGYRETMDLLDQEAPANPDNQQRLGFIETIFQLDKAEVQIIDQHNTIIFYSDQTPLRYSSPKDYVDLSSGVICFPGNFHGLAAKSSMEIRATHLASYSKWKQLSKNRQKYSEQKQIFAQKSLKKVEEKIGDFASLVSYQNSFTPVTIERYTSKIDGAIYGNPTKIKDGDIGCRRIFLAGTDQGFLGIIGSMLSGVSIVNQHILHRI
jgi:phytoene dehydrogenase-like protein